MYLARKITRAKWDPKGDLPDGEIAADAVTGDLRTKGNTLSFWRCHSAMNSDLEDAALAIAATWDRLDKLDLVWLATCDIQVAKLTLKETAGKTPVTDLIKRHVDLCKLDYVRLGKVAQMVAIAIGDKQHRRFTKASVRDLLVQAVREERLSLDKLSEGLRDEIATLVDTSRR